MLTIDELIEKPYWVVDLLPKQVPNNSEGQYFKVEKYYLNHRADICQKFINIILKLNCYYDIKVSHDGESWENNPAPEMIAKAIKACVSPHSMESTLFVLFETETSLIVIDNDSTYMTLYNPTSGLLELTRQLASAEGLFTWQPPN